MNCYCYDLNLHFKHKNTFNKPNLVHRFAIIDSVTKVFFNVVRKQNIEVYDIRNNKLINSYFEIPYNIRRNVPLGGPFILEHIKDGEVIFTQPFSNISYIISRSSFMPRYKWDFGKYNFDIDKLKTIYHKTNTMIYLAVTPFKQQRLFFLANADNNRFYLTQFSFGKNHDVYTVIHKKNSKEKIKFKELKEGLAFPYYPLLTDKYIYIVPRDTLVINRYLNEKIKKENGIVLDNWNEEQNPIILRYKLKNIINFENL